MCGKGEMAGVWMWRCGVACMKTLQVDYSVLQQMMIISQSKPITIDSSLSPIIQPSEARRKSRESQVAEARYAHLLDQVIIFSDVQTTAQEVVKTAERLRKDFQWVSSSWVHK